MNAQPLRLALLISGRGSTAAAIIKACIAGRLEGIAPACVIASSDYAPGITTVVSAGLSQEHIHVVSPKKFSSPEEFGAEILKICRKNKIDLIGQYGWLVKTPKNVIDAYKGMMINQHPGPLDPGRPDFGGDGMYGRRILQARILFVQRTGHDFWTEGVAQRVGEQFDEGAVIKTVRVPIVEGDTVEALSQRMLPFEHQLQIDALRDFANGTVKEIVRSEPLVRPDELEILNWAKKEAIAMYPKG